MHESAGRQDRGREAARQQMADAMLVEADSVGRMKGTSHLAARHARLTRRRGMSRAQVAPPLFGSLLPYARIPTEINRK